MYLPKARHTDGAYFGTSFPHVFMMHFPQTIILPPKIYYYEPKIFGFKIAGKRGSKTFEPPKGNVKFIEDSMQSLEVEEMRRNIERLKISNVRQETVTAEPANHT